MALGTFARYSRAILRSTRAVAYKTGGYGRDYVCSTAARRVGAPSRAIKARPVTCSNTSNIGKSAQASQGRAASNYYNHNITIFADASNNSTQARVLPGCFASSGVNGACTAVPYVERSLTRTKWVFWPWPHSSLLPHALPPRISWFVLFIARYLPKLTQVTRERGSGQKSASGWPGGCLQIMARPNAGAPISPPLSRILCGLGVG
jgi:hypothetical protein